MAPELQASTPLQNLFQYIQALYSTPKDYFDFSREDGLKQRHRDYQAWADLLALAEACRKEKIKDFALAPDEEVDIQQYVLRIKRQKVGDLPDIPEELGPWLQFQVHDALQPLRILEQAEIREYFRDSSERIQAWEDYSRLSQETGSRPELPPVLSQWVQVLEDSSLQVLEELKVKVKLSDIPPLQKQAETLRKDFESYYKKYRTPIQLNNLYDQLHSLYYALKGKEDQRLHLSFGLLSGTVGGQIYRNFLFHVPLKLQLRSQELRIELDTFANKIFCEQTLEPLLDKHFAGRPAAEIEQRKVELQEAVNRFNLGMREFDFDADYLREEYLDTALSILGIFAEQENAFFGDMGQLAFAFEEEVPDKGIRLSFSPILQTKNVEAYESVARDAQSIKQEIDRLQQAGELHLIPDFFKKLFAVAEPGAQPGTGGGSGGGETLPPTEKTYLFPLPYNQEQFEIAQRLDMQDAVTVKGPPGTGKSHTIANIISDNVARGRSILVVSQNTKALSVVRDKLPKDIQDLAVSLAEDSKGNEGLKRAVNAIIEHLSQRYEPAEAQRLEQQLEVLLQQQNQTLERIHQALLANSERRSFYNAPRREVEEKTAAAWAAELQNQGGFNFQYLLQEPLETEQDLRVLAQAFNLLLQYARALKPEEFDLGQYEFLSEQALPDLAELRRLAERWQRSQAQLDPNEFSDLAPGSFDTALAEGMTQIQGFKRRLQQGALGHYLLKQGRFDFNLLYNLLAQNQGMRQQVAEAERELLAYQLDLNALQDDPELLHRQVQELMGKFGGSLTLGLMGRTFLAGSLKRFFNCRVNGLEVKDLEQLKIIEKELNRRRCLKLLGITFNNYLQSFGLPVQNQIIPALEELDDLAAYGRAIAQLNPVLERKRLPRLDPRQAEFEKNWQFLERLELYSQFEALQERLREVQSRLKASPRPHPLLLQMADAYAQPEPQAYESLLERYRLLRDRQAAALRLSEQAQKVQAWLPQNVERLHQQGLSGQVPEIGIEVLERELSWMAIHHYLQGVLSRTSGSERLLQQLQTLRRSIEQKIGEIVQYEAWMYKAAQVSDTEKGALTAWLNDLTNYGKGKGKNADRNLASAVQNMQIAKNAVPIWIMPLQKALEFFPNPRTGQFDLLIIDEASQCDISSLNLIFRAKKALIVGDENQTSVTVNTRLFGLERTNELLDRFLLTHRFKTQFNVNNRNNSIYTISMVIYPNVVHLSEHFRCLPEIIGFSNRHMYEGKIVPLKTATHSHWGEPVELRYLEEEPKAEDKPKIVDEVVNLILEYIQAFEEKRLAKLPSVGILTLDSSNTKHQNRLLRQVAKAEKIREYEDQLELIIGTAREFQGDERDLMILTMAASHRIQTNKAGETLMRPPMALTSEEYKRIFNVAASRAKDKAILLHSIHPEAVSMMNSECLRRRLIDYFADQQQRRRQQSGPRDLQKLLSLVNPAAAEFESAVCRYLVEQGLASVLYPQFEVGRYRLDFALIQEGKKLGIECDSMQSQGADAQRVREAVQQQLVLERAGWRIFRLQPTDWFYEPENTRRRLMDWIRAW